MQSGNVARWSVLEYLQSQGTHDFETFIAELL